MPRRHYQRELNRLQKMLLEMGDAVERSLVQTEKALSHRDSESARITVNGDDAIDEMKRKIEDTCLRLIAMQQPVAGDLREITAIFRIIIDLERIADQAADICSCLLEMGKMNPQGYPLLSQICSALLPMYRTMLQSYQRRDIDSARETIAYDDKIDSFFEEAVQLFNKQIINGAGGSVYCVFIAKYLERIGDHITNICEWILYRAKIDPRGNPGIAR